MSYLLIDGLTVTYGAVRAVSQLSLSVEQGETVALIGPNGAGNPLSSWRSRVWYSLLPERSS